MELNKYFDHTLLKPETTKEDIKKLCQEAIEYDFYAICVNGYYASYAKELLAGSDVKIACVVGFPLGASSSDAKAHETVLCLEDGADEIDMVINIGALKDNDYDYCRDEINHICTIAHDYDALVKVIIETHLLTDEEKIKACEISVEAGADFVKTSTGFLGGGATASDISLMKQAVNGKAKVKASGGIRDLKTCLEMINAGADRIGASASVNIMNE